MSTRKLALILIAGLNEIVANLEEVNNESEADADVKPKKTKPPKDEDDDAKPAKKKASKAAEPDEDDEPTEEDVIKAVKGAVKLITRPEVRKLIKKYGKADEVEDVNPKYYGALLDALEEACDEE